jgi:uncharacterized cupin superfamily protein
MGGHVDGAGSIGVVRSADRAGWTPLSDPPGEAGTGGAETTAFTSPDGRLTVGLWTREPDTWSFERPYDEVALILEGDAQMEGGDGRVHRLLPGTLVVTPNGSKGRWRIAETLTKCFVIYEGGQVGDTTIRTVDARSEGLDWTVIPTEPGDPAAPGEETVLFRSIDGQASVGVWRRVPETGPMDLSAYHEIACLLEGEVDVAPEGGGEVITAGPGDVLVTPRGSRAEWRAKSPVRKVWAVYHGE